MRKGQLLLVNARVHAASRSLLPLQVQVQVSFRFKAACICTDTTAFPQASMKSLQYGAVLVLLLASLQSTQAETSVCHSIVGEEMCSTISSYLEFLPPSVRPPTKVNFG